MFILTLLGTIYTTADQKDIAHSISKSFRLLSIPIFISIINGNLTYIVRVTLTFAISMILSLFIILLKQQSNLIKDFFYSYEQNITCAFLNHIFTSGFLIISAAFIMIIYFCRKEIDTRINSILSINQNSFVMRLLLFITVFLLIWGAIFISTGRTGLLLLLSMLSFAIGELFFKNKIFRYVLLLLIITMLFVPATSQTIKSFYKTGYTKAFQFIEKNPVTSKNTLGNTYSEPRLNWLQHLYEFRNSIPIKGFGTGNIKNFFVTTGYNKSPPNNIHNQFLSYYIQFGYTGLLLLIFMFSSIFWSSIKEKSLIRKRTLQVIFLSYSAAFLVHSWLYDVNSSLLFCLIVGSALKIKTREKKCVE